MEFNIFTIVSYAIAIAIGLAGSYFGLFRSKLMAVKKLVDTVVDAIADGMVSPEEIQTILRAAREILK